MVLVSVVAAVGPVGQATAAGTTVEFQEALDSDERTSQVTAEFTLNANGTVHAQQTVDRGNVTFTFVEWTDLDSGASDDSSSWEGIAGHRYRVTYEVVAQRSAASTDGNSVSASGFVQGPSGSFGQMSATIYMRSPAFGSIEARSTQAVSPSSGSESTTLAVSIPNDGRGVLVPESISFSNVPSGMTVSTAGLPDRIAGRSAANGSIDVTVADSVSEGTYTFGTTVADDLGNAASFDVSVDVTVSSIRTVDASDATAAQGERGEITVTATDGDGRPVEGRSIRVAENDDLDGLDVGTTVETDANGDVTFAFEEDVRGAYTVAFSANDGAVTDTTTVTVTDEEAPTIASFTARNPSNRTVEVSFVADEPLQSIDVGIRNATSATLNASDFSESGSGPYTYTATYEGTATGRYTATLRSAVDASGNDGASGQSRSVDVGAPIDAGTARPTADVGRTRHVAVGDTVTFDGSNSTDSRNVDLYLWDLDGDGEFQAGETVSRTFDRPGSHTVELKVYAGGETATDTVEIVVAGTEIGSRTPSTPKSNGTTSPDAPATRGGTGLVGDLVLVLVGGIFGTFLGVGYSHREKLGFLEERR